MLSLRSRRRTYHGMLMCQQGIRTQVWEVRKDGTTVERATAVFKELDKGVWFVRRGKRELYFPDGQNNFTTVVKIDNVKINDPNITEQTFRFSLPEGTHGYDVTTKTSFVVGESSRIEVLDN